MTDEQSGASLNFLLAAFIIIAVAYFQSTFRRIDELDARIALLAAKVSGGQSCGLGSGWVVPTGWVVEQGRALPRAPNHRQSGAGSC